MEEGWPLRAAAERFGVSHTTAKRWADRYRQQGAAGMADRPSRPHRSPTRTPAEVEERIVALRRAHRLGPVRIPRPGQGSALHRAPGAHPPGLPRLDCCDRATGEPIRRYERRAPGELVHMDVKKLARIPADGGHKVLGRAEGRKRRDGCGFAFVHTALDDHSRLAYSEILTDETAATCAGFLTRAVAWFAAHGVTVERVLTDNAWAYTKTTWRTACARRGIRPEYTRPWRPQTNGKVERFHRTLLDEWAYHQP
ncbi:putative insertion element IS1652 transposase [Carbonactinospora thermoautotrophica]|uniref:Putative insertion element IS1652 transposase n=1 Tax=Carbonactinospora thermoautotrophica TaxID=1469144 RepID=A0A132MST8_9ACTN|nr:putative insertion element IS1652 transposase [Carbonactinospora thermoautotrophica]